MAGIIMTTLVVAVGGYAAVDRQYDEVITFRRGVEGELALTAILLSGLMMRLIAKQEKIAGAGERWDGMVDEMRSMHSEAGRLLRMMDAFQEAVLSSATDKEECFKCGERRKN